MPSNPREIKFHKTPSEHQQTLLSSAERQSSESVNSTSMLLQWKVEILSWIGSLCFFTAIVIVLWRLDGQPIPKLPSGIMITPNAIIGLLATFSEILLIVPVHSAIGQIKWLRTTETTPMADFRTFDEASRGPWGSALLIIKGKGGCVNLQFNTHYHTALNSNNRFVGTFGAIITIFALGISTFTQQTLKYDNIYPSTLNSQMPVARNIDLKAIDTHLASVPYVALFSPPNTLFTATATCGSGNCTWESYQTLGICNTCKDLSSELTRRIEQSVPFEGNPYNYTTYHYTLPNGFGISGRQPESSDPIVNAILNVTTTRTKYDLFTPEPLDSIAFKDDVYGSKLLSVFAVGAQPGTVPTEPEEDWMATMVGKLYAPPVAFECLFQFCVRNMRANFTNGTLFETEISNLTDQRQSKPSSYNNNKTSYESIETISLQYPGSATQSETRTLFTVSNSAVRRLRQWLQRIMDGNVMAYGLTQEEWRLNRENFYSQALVQPIYTAMNQSTTGFPDLMANLANSLTLNLRALPNQPLIQGKSTITTSQAVVTWSWLLLPLFELVGSLVFLTIVMIKTRSTGLVPWTNNVLAYFFHGLDERPFGGHVRESQHAMQAEAKDLLLEFQSNQHGSHLVVSKPGGAVVDL